MILFDYTVPKMIVADKGKHIREKKDVYVAEYTDEEGKWTQLGDWWYYTEVLQAGESTSELFIEIIKENAPEFNFDIVVIEESERVVYKDGKITPKAADWLYKDYKEAE